MRNYEAIFAILLFLASFGIHYPASAETVDWQKSGDWEYGSGNKLGMIWQCVGVTKYEEGFFILAALTNEANAVQVVPIVYSKDSVAFANLPAEALVDFEGIAKEVKLFDYADRQSNELSFFPENFDADFVQGLRSSRNVSFSINGEKPYVFSLDGVAPVLDFLQNCDAGQGGEDQSSNINPESSREIEREVSFGEFGTWSVGYIAGEPASALSYGDQCTLRAKDALGRADFSFSVFEDGPPLIIIFIEELQTDETWNLDGRVTGKAYVNFDDMETETLIATISPGWIDISATDNPSFFEIFLKEFPKRRVFSFVGSDQQGFGAADFKLDLAGSSKAMSALEDCYEDHLK